MSIFDIKWCNFLCVILDIALDIHWKGNKIKKRGFSLLLENHCLSSSSFLHHFSGITGIRSKKYFADHGVANTIQLFVATKGNISGVLFYWKSRDEVEFPRDFLMNLATCLFACQWNHGTIIRMLKQTLSNGQNPV